MATYAQNLETTRDNIAALLAQITADPNPDYTVGNRTISKGAYMAQLVQQLAEINKQLQTAGGSWEIGTRASY